VSEIRGNFLRGKETTRGSNLGVRSVRAKQVAVALGLVFELSRPKQIKTAALDNCLDMFRESEEAISQLVEPCVEVKMAPRFSFCVVGCLDEDHCR
jgi:hypothetical protein